MAALEIFSMGVIKKLKLNKNLIKKITWIYWVIKKKKKKKTHTHTNTWNFTILFYEFSSFEIISW